MMEFCKQFNAATANFKPSALMRVHLTAFDDRTFKYTVGAPSTSWYLKRVTGLAKGATSPGKEPVGEVSIRALYQIALSKTEHDPSVKGLPLPGLVKSLIGSARSMGLKVIR